MAKVETLAPGRTAPILQSFRRHFFSSLIKRVWVWSVNNNMIIRFSLMANKLSLSIKIIV